MPVLENEYPEFQDVADEICRAFGSPDMFIRRSRGQNYTENGVIYVDAEGSRDIFGGVLVHEEEHLVCTPVTVERFARYATLIAKRLGVPEKTAVELANAAADTLVELDIAARPDLSEWRRRRMDAAFARGEVPESKFRRELFAITAKLHGAECAKSVEPDPKVWKTVMTVARLDLPEEEKYVRLAAIFKPLLEEDKKAGMGGGCGLESPCPFKPTDDELRRAVENALANMDAEDARQFIKVLLAMVEMGEEGEEEGSGEREAEGRGRKAGAKSGGKGAGSVKRDIALLVEDDEEFLIRLFEEKAKRFRMSLPKSATGVTATRPFGTKKWRSRDGARALVEGVRKTIMLGLPPIPLVTVRTDVRRKAETGEMKWAPSPIPLVVCIDTSGSVGTPRGVFEDNVSDYEMLMLISLMDEAALSGQKMGVVLWHYRAYAIMEPVEPRKFRDLKRWLLRKWRVGCSTAIADTVEHINKHPDRMFFVFTDGHTKEVLMEGLPRIRHGNVHFFLIQPGDRRVINEFRKAYGPEKVSVVDKLEDIPQAALEVRRRKFRPRASAYGPREVVLA